VITGGHPNRNRHSSITSLDFVWNILLKELN